MLVAFKFHTRELCYVSVYLETGRTQTGNVPRVDPRQSFMQCVGCQKKSILQCDYWAETCLF